MDATHLVVLAFQVSIPCTVFGFGLRATVGDLLYVVHRPGLLARSLLAVFVIVPILAVAMVVSFDLRHTLQVALVAVAISPLPPLLPRKETKAGGHHAYGLGLMAILAVVAIVSVPLSAEVLERVFGRPLGASPMAIGRVVGAAVLLPLLAGVAVRRWLPGVPDRLEPLVTRGAAVLIVLAALALLAGTWRAILGTIGDGTALAVVGFVVVALAIGHVCGGPDPDHAVVLAISSACRHPAIALSIASANFTEERFGATILLYVLVNTAVGMAYLAWQRRRLAHHR